MNRPSTIIILQSVLLLTLIASDSSAADSLPSCGERAQEVTLLKRAHKNADAYYAAWKVDPPPDMMPNACLARILWFLADMETPKGKAFWAASEKPAREGK